MPLEQVPETDLTYFLIAFDNDGNERKEENGELMSERVVHALSTNPFTDIFIFSHGWKGDLPAAREQYNRWIKAMADCTHDIDRVKQVRPKFRPLLIGLHWPSLPWGDENLGGVAFGVPAAEAATAGATTIAGRVEQWIDEYAERIANTPEARMALRTIFESAIVEIAPPSLPIEVRQAYETLNREASLGSDREGAAPGHDREPFDPEDAYQLSLDEESDPAFGGFSLGGLLSPLRQLSFWKMKDRARKFGESGGFALLRLLQGKTGPEVRFHLMGHSFGCIVASAILGGPAGTGELLRPVDSVALVQGALSLWSYCSEIPSVPGKPGYFRSIIDRKKVKGTMFTTQSEGDTAVGRFYPIAAGIAQQVNFPAPGAYPKYGALGAFGVQGPGCDIVDQKMAGVEESNNVQQGKIYNLDSSGFISGGEGASGSHNEIDKPEVAHAFWEAVRG
jgi:hypothetical protein